MFFLYINKGAFISQHEDHLHMFTVDDSDSDTLEKMYPHLEESLRDFNPDELEDSDDAQEPICNYEWADDIDVINVLHGVSEWPVALQVCFTFFFFIFEAQNIHKL